MAVCSNIFVFGSFEIHQLHYIFIFLLVRCANQILLWLLLFGFVGFERLSSSGYKCFICLTEWNSTNYVSIVTTSINIPDNVKWVFEIWHINTVKEITRHYLASTSLTM